MKKKVFWLVFITMLVTSIVLAACSAPAPAPTPSPTPTPTPPPRPIELKALGCWPVTHIRTNLALEFYELIKERSNGELVISYLGATEVIATGNQPTAIQKGVIDLHIIGSAAYAPLVPSAPLLAISRVTHKEELAEGGAYQLLREDFAKAGLYFLGRVDAKEQANFLLGLNKKVETPYELKGLKQCGTTTVSKAGAEALGLSFGIVTKGDRFTAMDTGVYDAIALTPGSFTKGSLGPVIKYGIDHLYYKSNTSFIMNLDSWNQLPGHLQQLILDAYRDFAPELERRPAEEAEIAMDELRQLWELIKFSEPDAKYYLDTLYEAQLQSLLETMPAGEDPSRLLEAFGYK